MNLPRVKKGHPRRRMRAEDRRGLILEQARKLFTERGYARTSLDDVAAAAGITKPVVYDHFPSKRELYFELMRQLRDELVTSASQSLAEDAAPEERFRAAIENFFRQVRRDPAFVQILFVQSRTEPDLADEWERLQDEALAALRPLARALAPTLSPWKINVALHLVHHGLNATATAWPRKASASEMSELVYTLLWKGLETVR
jgi:AcrR family transcriptional regulator